MTPRAQEIRTGLAWLHAADPVLAQVIDDRALLIALQRPDAIRTGDLALRHSIQARYGLDHLPDPAEVADLAPALEALPEHEYGKGASCISDRRGTAYPAQAWTPSGEERPSRA